MMAQGGWPTELPERFDLPADQVCVVSMLAHLTVGGRQGPPMNETRYFQRGYVWVEEAVSEARHGQN